MPASAITARIGIDRVGNLRREGFLKSSWAVQQINRAIIETCSRPLDHASTEPNGNGLHKSTTTSPTKTVLSSQLFEPFFTVLCCNFQSTRSKDNWLTLKEPKMEQFDSPLQGSLLNKSQRAFVLESALKRVSNDLQSYEPGGRAKERIA